MLGSALPFAPTHSGTLCCSRLSGSGARTRPPLDPHGAWRCARPRFRSPDPPCRGDRPATLRSLDPLGPPRHHDAQRTERILKQVSSLPGSIELVRHQQSGKADAAAVQQAEERLGNSVVVAAVRRVRHQGRGAGHLDHLQQRARRRGRPPVRWWRRAQRPRCNARDRGRCRRPSARSRPRERSPRRRHRSTARGSGQEALWRLGRGRRLGRA